MSAASRPLDWIQEIDSVLVELDEKPQFPSLPTFPWDRLTQVLQKLFQKPNLKLRHEIKGWALSTDALKGDLKPLEISWAPLNSSLYFAMNRSDLRSLMAELLGGDAAASYFFEPDQVQGFYKYFTAELLSTLTQINFAHHLTPHLEDQEPRSLSESCFVVDVALELSGKTFWGKILAPESFRNSWKSYFGRLPPLPMSEEKKAKTFIDVGLQVGNSGLTLEEYKSIRIGDFVLLDHCSYDPFEKKGGVILTLQQKPIFRGRFKDGNIKITNYPVYEEVAMEKESFDSDEEDIYGDLEDFETEASESATEEKVSISPEELPVNLTIEAGKLRMTVKELMDLAPGSLLDLHVYPDQGVDVLANGKKVGKGELVRLGETLGVRILSI